MPRVSGGDQDRHAQRGHVACATDRGCHKAVGTGVLCVAQSRANRQEPAMSERSERTTDTAEPPAQGDHVDAATEAFLAHRNLLFTVAYDVELADSVSMAMLLVLETLTPTERAVFVLREVFDLEYDEIAEAVDKSPAAVRQIAHRARAHVAARRPRGVVSPAQTRDALQAFQRAVGTGDMQHLLDILAPDVVFLGDGGGVVKAALTPVVGADRVARLLAGGLGRIAAAVSLQPAQVNGYPALILRLNGEIDTVIAVRIDDGLITGLYAVRNPEKLSRVERETAVSR